MADGLIDGIVGLLTAPVTSWAFSWSETVQADVHQAAAVCPALAIVVEDW